MEGKELERVILTNEIYKDIADAIRTHTGEDASVKYTPPEMGPAVKNLFSDVPLPGTLLRIGVVELPNMIHYVKGQSMHYYGWKVIAFYSNGDEIEVTNKVTTNIKEGQVLGQTGTITCRVYYVEGSKRVETSFQITVADLEIVSWANGTDEQVAKMIEAADNGLLDLEDYWSIGDERDVHVNSVDADLYFMYTGVRHHDNKLILMSHPYDYVMVNPTRKNKGSFVVQLRDLFYSQAHYVSGYEMGGTGDDIEYSDPEWHKSMAWMWLNRELGNNPFNKALPEWLRNLVKEVYIPMPTGYKSNEFINTPSKYFLPSEIEVFGRPIHCNPFEADLWQSQWEYYKTREKTKYLAEDCSTAGKQWLRSQLMYLGDQDEEFSYSGQNNAMQCIVDESGSAAGLVTSTVAHIAPAFII